MHHLTDRITHTTAFVTPVMEHWLEREIAQWVHRSESDEGCDWCIYVTVVTCAGTLTSTLCRFWCLMNYYTVTFATC